MGSRNISAKEQPLLMSGELMPLKRVGFRE